MRTRISISTTSDNGWDGRLKSDQHVYSHHRMPDISVFSYYFIGKSDENCERKILIMLITPTCMNKRVYYMIKIT